MNYISMSYAQRQIVIILSFILLLTPFFGHSQIIKWDPSLIPGGTITAGGYGPSPWTPATINANLAFTGGTSGLIRGSSMVVTGSGATSCYGAAGGFTSTSSASGEANSWYFQFTVNSGYVVSLTTMSGNTRRSGSGPTGCDIHYSVGGGAYVLAGSWSTTLTTGTVGTPGSTDLSAITALQNVAAGTVIKIRITPIGATGGSWYFTNTSLALAGTVLPICTGTPNQGTVAVGTSTICSGATTTLTLGSATTGSGISYKWQQSANGTTWSDVSTGTGFTALTYSTPALSTSTFYRCQTTCSNSATTVTSTNSPSVTVVPNPSAGTITGGSSVCVGSTLSLSTTGLTGGTWTPTAASGAATIGGSTGIVTGVSAGTKTFTYTAPIVCGSAATLTVTVNALPAVGSIYPSTPGVQIGSSVSLYNPTATGTATWSSVNGTGSVTITSSGGVVTGVTQGTATISYSTTSAAGCGPLYTTRTIYINGLTPTISSISPLSGIPGSTVVINGTNFDPASSIVYFGATKATINAGSSTTLSLSVVVPAGALYGPVSVTSTNNYTAYSPAPFTPIYNNSGFVSNTLNFNSALILTSGATPYSGAMGDLNNDGQPDLVVNNTATVAGSGSPSISIFKNVMTGIGVISGSSFSLTSTITTSILSYTPNNVKLADIDGDGKLDIIVPLPDAAYLLVYRNTTSGVGANPTFATPVSISAAGYTSVAAIRDFDGDGKPDLALSGFAVSNYIIILPNTSSVGSVSFGTAVVVPAGAAPSSVCIADFDSDGLPDVACPNSGFNSGTGTYSGSTITVAKNTSTYGSISFGTSVSLTVGSGPLDVAAGDINNDGKSDLLVTNSNSGNISIFINSGATGTITASSFASAVNFTSGSGSGSTPTGIAVADLNGDGKLDVVVSNNADNTVSIFRNLASGSTVTLSLASPQNIATGNKPVTVTIGDLDADGYPDIVTGNRGGATAAATNTITILKNYPKPPIGTSSGTATICPGSSTTFSNTVSGGGWALSNTTNATITSTGVVTGVVSGTDTVIYYTAFGGDSSFVYTPITISPAAPSVSASALPSTLCTGTTLILSGSVSGTSVYSWSGPNGFSSTIMNPTALITSTLSAGVYSLTASNSCGTITATTSAIAVNVAPSLSITGSNVIPLGSSTSLTISGNNGDVVYYSWTGGASSTTTIGSGGTTSFTVTPTTTTVYSLDSAISLAGCFAVISGESATVTVDMGCTAPPTSVTSNASASGICLGNSVTLTGSAVNAISYQWSGPNGYTSTDLSPASFTVSTASAGIYTLSATNACGTSTSTTTFTVLNIPSGVSANLSNTTVCSGQLLTLTGTATGATSYSWAYPNGSSSTNLNPAAITTTISSAGIYTLTATNSCGSVSTSTASLSIINAVTSVSASLSSSSVCNGNNLTLTGAASNATSYAWAGPNSFTSTDAIPASFAVSTASAGIYTFTATNFCGNVTATTSLLSIITTPSVVTASPSATSICTGLTLSLNGTATGATSYSWSGPNSFTSTDLNPAAFPVNTASAGSYTLAATNSCGTVSATTSPISILNIPTAVIATLSSSTICNGGTLTLTGSATNALIYSWSGPNGYSSSDLNPASFVVNTVSAGVYSLTATNTCGSATASSASLSVLLAPSAVSAAASSYTVCAGSTLTLTGVASGASTYSWSGPNSFSSTLLNPGSFTVNTASAGIYSFTATNSCGSASATTTAITVNTLPTASVSGTATIVSGSTTTLLFTGTANATVYYWNGSATTTTTLNGAGSSTVTVTPTVTTTYTLTSATSVAGCSQSISGAATITVTPASWINLSNVAPTYTQNFNSLPNTGTTFTWTDNGTIQGWYAAATGTASYRVDNGSSTSGGVFSYGTTSATDRALGSLGSGTPATQYYGARFKNNGTSNIVGLTVSYTGEQWRNGGPSPAAAQSNTVDYQVAATSITAGTWTNAPALTFTSPVFSTTAAALDGNATANRTAISSTISTTVAPGQEVWIRMVDINDASNDHGLSMDDLTVTAIYAADYYSLAGSNNLDNIATWGTNTNGTGSNPSNFTTAGQVFHVANGNTGTFSGSSWTVSGGGAKIALDAATDLAIGSSTTVTAIIDVAAGRTLTISNATLPTLGSLDATSTIVYNGLNFTSTSLLPNTTSNAVSYGNLVLNNTSVAMPTSAVDLTIRGNMTLSGTSPFAGGDSTSSTNGYNLVTSGTANQTISGNGNIFYVRNIDINNTAGSKTGTVTLASNTPILAGNSFRMNITGAANRFSDGGNTIKVFNNASMGGDALGYNLTGTLYMAATTASGNTNIRGYVSGAAVSTVAAVPVFNNITVNNGTTSTVAFTPSTGAATYTLTGSLNIASTGTGALLLNPNTINIGGNFTHTSSTNAFTAGTSTVIFNGAAPQTYTTNVTAGNTFNNLAINNGSTVTLNGNMTVGSTLSLSSGNIVTGTNTLTLSSTSTITGGTASSYVNGNLSRAMPGTGVTSMIYPVGDVTFSPGKLTFSSLQSSGSVLVKSTAGSHPSISGSYIDVSNAVNRYWTITSTGVAPSTVNIDLSYNSGDITGAGTNGSFILRKYNGSSWSTAPTTTNSTSGTAPLLANVTTTTGTTGSTYSGDYVAGNSLCTSPTAGAATSSSTSVCSGSNVTLSLTGASLGAAISYQWQSSPNGSTYSDISGATTSTYTANMSVLTYFKCNVGCIPTGSTALSSPVSITITPLPSSVVATSSATALCVGQTLTLSGSATGSTSYAWSGPGGFTSTDLNPASIIVNTASAGIYSLTATNLCGNTVATTASISVNDIPSAVTASASSYTLCSGSTFTLSGSATGIATYSWSGPSAFSSTNLNPASFAVNTASAGVYTLTVTNLCGTVTAITSSVIVNALPVATISGSATISLGSSATLTFTGSNGDIIYYSLSGGGSTSTTVGAGGTSLIPVSPSSTTTYTIDSTRSAAGCFTLVTGQNATVTIDYGCTIAPTSVSASLSSTSICNGNTLTLTGAATNANSYSWSGPNGFTSTNQNPAAFTVGSVSAGIYSFTATNYCGSTTTTTASLSIITTPTALSATPSSTTLCSGAILTLSGLATGATSYSWSGPNSFTSTDLNPSAFTVNTASAGSYTLAATNSCGTVTSATSAITISNTPTAVTTALSSSSICNGGTLTLTGSATNALSYSWSGPNGFTSTVASPASFTVNTASAGVYTFTATNTCGNTTAMTATLSILSVPSAVSAMASSYTVCSGSTLTLTGAASGATTYSWSGPNSFSSTLLNPASFTVNTASAGIYSLTATNSCGIASTTTTAVTVNSLPTASVLGTATIGSGSSTTLLFTGTANATVYYWNGSATTTTTLNGSGSSTVTVTPTITTTYTLTSVTSVAGCSQVVSGSVTITVTAATYISLTNVAPTYTQNFNSLPNTGTTFTWTDNGTIQGWYAAATGTASYRVDNGSSTSGGVFSYGTTSATDRALGSLGSGTPATQYYGARFKNNGTTNIVGLTVSYTGEQWRNGGPSPAAAQSNTVDYQVAATSITAGTWTNAPALTFTSPVFSTTAAALDGNATANRTAISSTISTTVAPGQEVWIRMVDINDASNDHGLSMDDLTVTAIYAADYYSLAGSNNLDNIATWGTNTNGTGSNPSNFTTAGQVFHVANGNTGTFSGSSWTVSGGGAKIALDAATDLAIGSSTTVTAIIDVAAGRTLTISNATLPTLGSLDATSTIVYNGLNFTSTSLLPNTTSNAVSYGNLVLNNTSVAMPTSAVDLTIRGNMTLSGTSPFAGGDSTSSTNGYNLVTSGTANQTISGNGNIFYVRNIDINNTAGSKTGTVTLASNTPILAGNSFRMNITGAANRFSDGGNTIKVFNNASMGGDALGYNLTGTLYMAATTASGNTNIRGYVSGAAVSTVAAVPVFNNITVNNGTTSTVAFAPSTGAATYTLIGSLNIASTGTGALLLNPNTINIGGNFTHTSSTNAFTAGTSTVIFNGAAPQTYTTNVVAGNTFNNLTINNGSTITLNGIINVTNTIGLINGVFVTGSGAVSLSSAATVSGGGTSSYVKGNLFKAMPAAGTTSMTYQVGDLTYSPVKLTFSSSINSGSITVKSTSGAHPSMSGSYVDASAAVNRYWTITPAGVAPSTVNIDFSYNNGDIAGGGANGGFILRQYSGSTWSTMPFVSNSTSGTAPLLPNVTTTTGTSGASFSGDYVVGNALCSTPSGGTTAATSTTVCSGSSTTLSLSGASANSAITYQWQSSPDGIVAYTNISGATSASYSVTPASTTFYKCQVTCQLTSNTALSAPITINTGTAPSSVSASISATTICDGSNISLVGSATGATSYSWNGPGGYTSTNLNPASFTVNTASSGVYTLSATNSCGTYTAPTAALIVYATPTAVTATAASTALCSGNGLVLNGTASGASNYSWAGPDSYSSTDLNPASITVGTASAGVYTLTATNICGTLTATTASVTVSPVPFAVIATASATTLCAGNVLTLTGSASSATSYSWNGPNGFTSSLLNPSSFTVGTASAGSYTFTATNSCGSNTASVTVAVNAAPTSITASPSATTLCAGTTLTLTGSAVGATSYVWNGPGGYFAPTAVASFAIGTANAGSYTLTATNSCGSTTVATTSLSVTGTPTVAAISATATTVGIGGTLTLSDATPSGTWSSTNAAIATVSPSGVVTGIGAGAATISYAVSGSCGVNAATQSVLVTPSAIELVGWNVSTMPGGTNNFGSSPLSPTTTASNITLPQTLTRGTGIGTTGSGAARGWGGTDWQNSTVANAVTGNDIVTFSMKADAGYAVNLSSCTIAYRRSGTGPGNGELQYSIDGTNFSTVVALSYPTTSSGGNTISGINLSSIASLQNVPSSTTVTFRIVNYGGTAAAGTWYLFDVANTPASDFFIQGSVVCSGTPAAGTVAVTGTSTFCNSGATSLTFTPGVSSTGTSYQWSSSNDVASTSFTPISGATSGSYTTGTLTDTTYYNVATTCSYSGLTATTTNATITVNPLPVTPAAITGATTVCAGSTVTLFDATSGGTWTSVTPGVATISSAGVVSAVSAGTTVISYTMSTPSCGSASATTTLTVNALPSAGTVTGPVSVCVSTSSPFTNTATGGTWSTSDVAIATVSASGTVYGVASGSVIISYTNTNGCGTAYDTMMIAINTSASAGVISGTTSICLGTSSTLSDGIPGGTWSSVNNSVATITSTGIVTGVTADTVTIAYTVNTSCGTAVATTVVTVNPILSAPPAITGTLSVCPAATTTLSDLASGGTWTTSDPSIATINSVGMVTGVTSGSATITYTINNLCGSAYITTPFTVNPLPVVGAITGSATVCNGSSASLSDITSGGVWTSGSPAIASVNSSTGVVSGLTLGNATIAYAVTNSCGTTTVNRSVSVITVPVLSTITGATMVYNGASTTLSDTATSGAWTSNNPSIATVGATGIVTGSSLGTTTITYSATNSCGTAFVTSPMTVLTPVSAAAAFWNFTVGSGSTSQATSSSSTNVLASNCIASVGNVNGTVTAISSTSASTTLSGYSGGNNIGNAAFTGTLSSTSSYIQFTLTPNSGYFINISGMSFAYRGTGTGPQAYTIKTSADGYSSAVATGSLSNTSTWLTATPTFASSITGGSSTSLTVRVYGHSGTGSPGASTINWRMDDVNINFTANQNICSGTPAAGTAAITGPAATCGTGSTSLTFTPGVNALGTTYQWSESNSATGSFTPIAGATSAVYTTPTLTDTAYYVTTTTCNYSGLSANTAVNTVNINALPTIALSAAMPTVCQPTTSAPVSFSASTGSPTTYSINWNATADSAGFTDVTGATLSGSSLPLVMPATGAVGTFTGSLTVSNGMCTSAPYTVTTNILAYPTATVTSLDVPCIGHSGVVYVTGTPSDAIWYMVDSGTIINTTISAGGTFTISTGVISTPHNYSIVSVANAVCTTYVDTVVYVNPTPMQWIGGSAGHLTDWNYAGNWACNTVPTISDNVTVDSGTYIPIISGPTAVNALDLKLGQGATLVLNTGAVLNVKGMIDNNGTVSGDGRVIMNNTTSQIIKGRGTISNLELNNASGAAVDSGARLVISNTLYITSGTLTTSDSLELASSDSVTTARIAELPAVGGSISGKVKVDQYVQGHYRRFRFWSHPFDAALSLSQIQSFIDITGPGGSVNGFRSTSSNAPSAFRLDPYTENDTLGYDPGWKPFTKINAFAADSNKVQPYQGIRLFFRGKKGEGLGYLGYLGMYNPSATTVKMLGNINQGPQTAFMQQGHLDPDHQSFNMMGNPYPSPIDIGEVIWRAAQSGNVQGAAFYVWDPTLSAGGNFITIPIGTTSPVHYNISANTCFQVRAGHDGDSLNFVESDKVSSFDNYLFKAPSDYLTLNVYDSNYHIWDALNVQFNDKATDIEDSKFDAVKQLNADFTFYSLSADKRKLAIDARPFEAEKVVPLGISSAYDQRFIIRADNLAVPKGTTVFLNDKLLNKLTELKPGTEYAFTITKDKATQGDARFELSLKAATAPTDNGLHVTMTPNPASDDVHITFTTTQKENVSVRVMDISGVNVYNKDLGVQQNGTVNVSLSNLAAGIYMVELTSGDKKVLHRLVKE